MASKELNGQVTLSNVILRLSIWAVGIFAIMVLGYFLLPSRYQPLELLPSSYKSNFLLWSWANFDGEHYLSIAKNGYQTIRTQSEYAFFPLFPLLIKALGTILFGDYYLASHIIVSLSLIGFVYLLLKDNPFNLKDPSLLVIPILLFPGSIFLASIYTEPLFLFLTTLVFIAAKDKKWGRAAIFTALATATRINGLSLVIFLALALWQSRVSIYRSIAYILTSFVGIGSYMLYLQIVNNNALSFFTAQGSWGKSTLTMPWETIGRYLRALTVEFSFDLVHFVVAVEVVVTLYLLFLLFTALKKRALTLPYLIYCLFNLALPLATGSLGSMPRFGLLLFPLFVITSSFNKSLRAILYIVSGLLAATGVILFTRGYWWA